MRQRLANGNNFMRIGRPAPGSRFRVSIGPAYNHYKKMGTVKKAFSPIHIHMDSKYGGAELNWGAKKVGKKLKLKTWQWWKR
jgi:hypothetical protein